MNYGGNYNPNIDYSKYSIRRCGQTWEYCDNKCMTCNKNKYIISNKTINIIPSTNTNKIYYNSSTAINGVLSISDYTTTGTCNYDRSFIIGSSSHIYKEGEVII